MGLLWSYIGYGDTNKIDPITGLTEREKRLIQSTRANLMTDAADKGAIILYKYFEKHPEYQQYFPFRDVPLNELKANKKFQVHCNSVMYALASWIDNLDNPEILIAILSKLGLNHEKHKLPEKSFWDLRDCILEVLKLLFDANTYAAFEKFYDLAIKTALSPSL